MRLSLLSPLDSLIAPPPKPARIAFLKAAPFAHRGLHGHGVIENSRAAFRAAIAAGHGIELDVQASSENDPMVFHDVTLERLTDEEGEVSARAGGDLERVRLKASEETIPRLPEILSLIGGRVPLLIEVKAKGFHVGVLCLAVRRALEGYLGSAAVMSFNPQVGRWFHDHAPRIVRGLVITEEGDRGLRGRAKRHLALWRAKPDFLAYDVRDLPSRFAAQQRARGLAMVSWTVRTRQQHAIVAAHADQPIYENAFFEG